MRTCEHMEQLALLAGSGEADARQLEALAAHLAGCARCRSTRADWARVVELAGVALPVGEPALAVREAIRREARLRAGTPVRRWRFLPLVLTRPAPALALAAAALLLAVGGWWLSLEAVARHGGEDMATILALVADDAGRVLDAADAEARMKALAEELLALQEWGDGDTDEAITASDEERPATDPLSHRTRAFVAAACG